MSLRVRLQGDVVESSVQCFPARRGHRRQEGACATARPLAPPNLPRCSRPGTVRWPVGYVTPTRLKALLHRKYAPVTDAWGFLAVDFDRAISFFASWLAQIRSLRPNPFQASLDDALKELGGQNRLRVLVASTQSEWVAVFADRKDAYHSEVAHPSAAIPCRGLHVMCVETTYDPRTKVGEFGAVAFQTLADHPTDFLNIERTVQAGYYDVGWEFHADGPVLPFEQVARYRARRIRDRFTPEMLEEYARALGIRLFDAAFYGPRFVLFSK